MAEPPLNSRLYTFPSGAEIVRVALEYEILESNLTPIPSALTLAAFASADWLAPWPTAAVCRHANWAQTKIPKTNNFWFLISTVSCGSVKTIASEKKRKLGLDFGI